MDSAEQRMISLAADTQAWPKDVTHKESAHGTKNPPTELADLWSQIKPGKANNKHAMERSAGVSSTEQDLEHLFDPLLEPSAPTQNLAHVYDEFTEEAMSTAVRMLFHISTHFHRHVYSHLYTHVHMHVNVSIHVCRHVYRYLHRHEYRHVHGRMHGHEYRYVYECL